MAFLVRRLLCASILLGVLGGCRTLGPPTPQAEPSPWRAPETIRVAVEVAGDRQILVLPLEQYVQGCTAAERGISGLDSVTATTVLRVQALVCRTWALANLGRHRSEGFDVCSTVHCQLFRPVPPGQVRAAVQRAVAETAGELLIYRGRPIQALFHSDCGGRTSAAEEVWGGRNEPYLQAVHDRICERRPQAHWRLALSAAELGRLLHHDARTDAGLRVREVEVAARDSAGRAQEVRILGDQTRTVRGEVFRGAILSGLGPMSLRSTLFSIERSRDEFVFEGRGSGHGVGLCQAGALALARRGATIDTILAHYYPDARLSRLAN